MHERQNLISEARAETRIEVAPDSLDSNLGAKFFLRQGKLLKS
jgi:hypothetical protein